ncbi:MAG: hypothetical protein IAF38_12185 [Bacteroidia bacterium]|nr:hypothetical protein [Bacteroidia bacterium]
MATRKLTKQFLFSFCILYCFAINAQLITNKNGKYGLMNKTSGDVVLEQKYDSIYRLRFRPIQLQGFSQKDPLETPLFACISNKQIQIFNSYNTSFYKGSFDEIKLYRQSEEQSYTVPHKYIPYWVDCFMLRKGKYWGYIAYEKEYYLDDKLEQSDTFKIIEPQYLDLKFIGEENGYSSQDYVRKKRIMAALKDSLWGALKFETGEEIVPFRHKLPIHSFHNSYNNRGIEFLSTKGGFIPYYIACKNYDSKPQVVINALGADVSFEFNYNIKVNIYNEFGKDYLYIEPVKDEEGVFKVFDYNSGKLIFEYPRNLDFYYFENYHTIESVLAINESTANVKLTRVTWFNLVSGKIILFCEGKSYFDMEFDLRPENGSLIVYRKSKPIGKIVGEGENLHIEWVKKVYLKEPATK